MNIIPELMINELDLEEVNTIYSLNPYYKNYCYNNSVIQLKLKEAKLAAKNMVDSIIETKIISCQDIRQISYYRSLLTDLNIQIGSVGLIKDFFIYRIKIYKSNRVNYTISLIGKLNNLGDYTAFRMADVATKLDIILFLTYLYYNQIL